MSREIVREEVPPISRRMGELVLAGANNSALILGRDRVTTVDTGYGSVDSDFGGRRSGSAHLVVGRSSQDPDVRDDSASVYISMKTDPDDLVGTDNFGVAQVGVSAVILRGDCIRITARRDFKLSVGSSYLLIEDDRVTVESQNIRLGRDAIKSILLGEDFAALYSTHTHPYSNGVTGPPTQPIPQSIYSQKVKI